MYDIRDNKKKRAAPQSALPTMPDTASVCTINKKKKKRKRNIH